MVAGVAFYTLSNSKNVLKVFGTLIRYPLSNVRILESSKAEFKFSTHMGSTTPSKITQIFLCGSFLSICYLIS